MGIGYMYALAVTRFGVVMIRFWIKDRKTVGVVVTMFYLDLWSVMITVKPLGGNQTACAVASRPGEASIRRPVCLQVAP